MLFSQQIIDRGIEVDSFYNTLDKDAAQKFLRKYDVRYVIVGQLEVAKYSMFEPGSPDGLVKFEMWHGDLWNEVYRNGNVVIYEVIQ